jgi:pyruvate dehydrogenase E2 component (dihydrolipoamide acetyltransferase)
MPVDIVVPPLSQTMDTVVLLEWLKAVGEEVEKGEPLFVIETDKASLDVEAPASGVLQTILVEPGNEIEVRSTIGVIGSEGEVGGQRAPVEAPERSVPASGAATEPLEAAGAPTGPKGEPLPEERRNRVPASPRAQHRAEQEGISLAEVTPTGPEGMVVERDVEAYLEAVQEVEKPAPIATPVARRLAEHSGIDLGAVEGTGRQGRVTKDDVEAALADEEERVREGVEWIELSPTRKTIARRMHESQGAAAEVTLTRDVDVTRLVELREQILEDLSEDDSNPTYTDLLLSIVARQLAEHPEVNAITDGERLGMSKSVHVAAAVDTNRGLVTPVVRDADRKGLVQLAQERADLGSRAMDGSIAPDELSGGTFTVTNLGPLGIDAFTPIINPPQIAILGIGRIRTEPAVLGEEVCIRQRMSLSLTFDHRFIDGAPAARFLSDVVRLIESPHLVWL